MTEKNEGIVISGGALHAQQVVVGRGAQGRMSVGEAAADKADLEALLQQWTERLAAKGAARPDEAEIVQSQAAQLVEMAGKEAPSPSLLKVLGKGLKETAGFIKDVAPEAVETVERLIGLVAKLHGIGF
jgi:hypothetical protein